ncbi:hypothetical protein HNR23_000919 [Nocardiopsis mwathae]|uniref:DUF4870 domain-containing protein n=1 Tax=Nocardiopsis mwathae TaxID=1472723 RepID=A0A7W9YET8_9ACTN|nr:DUF4870 domain-containing protein [Nocardiopsis mwathae]MBB6170859.1 hypothetical protein [Nocardiopsis mwathae]
MSNPYPPGPPHDGQNTPYNHPGGYSPPPGADPGHGPQSAPGMPPGMGPQPYPQQPYPQPGAYQQQGHYQQPYGYPQQPYGSTPDDRTMALLAHLGGLFLSFLVPLVLYLVKKDESPFVRHHAAQALNFQILVLIVYVVSWVLTLVFIGVLTFFAMWIAAVVLGIMAAVAANKGEWYTYPIGVPVVK